MMSKEILYNDGLNRYFIRNDYQLTPESAVYVLRGYSDLQDREGNFYFSICYDEGEGYFLKPDNIKEDSRLLEMLVYVGIPFETDITDDGTVAYVFRDCNLVDFMHKVFSEDMGIESFSKYLFEDFVYEWDYYKPNIDFEYTLNDKRAVPPTKQRCHHHPSLKLHWQQIELPHLVSLRQLWEYSWIL